MSYNMPPAVVRWISVYLSNRSQCTKFANDISCNAAVNLGVVQGSALGPYLFNIMVADLVTLSDQNDLVKYADDMTLIVPEGSNVSLEDEFSHIQKWASLNNFSINFSKTKEMVFHASRISIAILPPPLSYIERVSVSKLLGIRISDTLRFSEHVSNVLACCSSRMFLMRNLKNKGLSTVNLEVIFYALIVSKVLFALSAWGGFISASDRGKVDAMLKRCRKYGYCNSLLTFDGFLHDCDSKLFMKMCSPSHCLNHLLPKTRPLTSTLRERGHPFILPHVKKDLFKNSFIIRSLFNFC